MDKKYIGAQELLEDSVKLGAKILQSDFRPDFMVGVWRGGSPVGIVVQELLEYYGVATDHISIRTSSYTGVGERGKSVRVHGLDYLVQRANADDSLLLVDDVFDSGRSLEAVLKALGRKSRKNLPRDIRIATVYYKPGNNETGLKPDFFIHETDRWLVFPHEVEGMSLAEICEHKPGWKDTIRELDVLFR
ncbi:MAG: phosphoribosyltransferase family protein [Gammaproteobacteria bacterium]|nr:phosphoribosyltransferase family protein [Gammaproteobacteria bacterium]